MIILRLGFDDHGLRSQAALNAAMTNLSVSLLPGPSKARRLWRTLDW
jgi:hypothetical protein